MIDILQKDLWRKLFALFLAIFIWSVIHFREGNDRFTKNEIIVSFSEDLRAQYPVLEEKTLTTSIVLFGNNRTIQHLLNSDIVVLVDKKEAIEERENNLVVTLTEDYFHLPLGVFLEKIIKAKLRVPLHSKTSNPN